MLDLVIREFQRRRILFADKLCPLFCASYCCHVFNLANRRTEAWVASGHPVDSRLHLLYVAPTGCGKNLYLEHFLEEGFGVLHGTLPTKFEGSMTEAGFVGTIKTLNGEVYERPGLAREFSEGIVGIEEFSAITKHMSADYGLPLDTQLLSALDSGRVVKRLGAGVIEYRTSITLWTATQPARYELRSGLGRRFLFLCVLPTWQELQRIRRERRRQKGVRLDPKALAEIQEKALAIKMGVQDVRSVDFDIYDLMDQLGVPHWEEMLMERLALGLFLARYGPERHMTVVLSREDEDVMALCARWRRWTAFGAEKVLFLRVLRSVEPVNRHRFLDMMTHYGYDHGDSTRILAWLRQHGYVKNHANRLETTRLALELSI